MNGLEDATALRGRIVPSAVIDKGGEKIGLVGATTQILEAISSTGGVEVKGFAGDGAERNDMALLAAQLQPVIDDLRTQGVDKIILMAHLQQIDFEIELAPLLSGVDIILAAGSNTRLGDATDVPVAFPGHAANFADTYPILATGADGGTTLIVNTDNEFTYLGRVVVEFDDQGRIITESLDPAINGAYAATRENVAAAWGVTEDQLDTTAFAEGTKGEQVADITEAVQAVIEAKDGEVWGFTNVYLEGERNLVRNQETNLGNLTADANLFAAREALGSDALVVSLKNGGGIRTAIGTVEVGSGEKDPPIANPAAGKPEGGISTLDIENSLRFNNRLVVFDTTAAGLKAILEHGVASLGNQGRFPQIGGIAFSYDPDLPAGSRVLSIAAIDENGDIVARIVENGMVSADAPSLISVVTLNFLAQGGDSYPMKANGENFRYLLADGTLGPVLDKATDISVAPSGALGEQQALKDFLQDFHATSASAFDEADTAASGDTRIQNLNATIEDSVLDGVVRSGNGLIEGTAGDDVLTGGLRADTLVGGAGDDRLTGGFSGDSLLGGSGADTIDAGGGANVVDAGTGDDLVFAAAGMDTLRGGEGDDTIRGGFNADCLFGDAGDDLVLGEGGFDVIEGGIGADTLDGGLLDDTIDGGADGDLILGGFGADSLLGGGGDDTIDGGLGRDTIIGGEGDDLLIGGGSADRFIFGAGDGNDTILGYAPGERLVLVDGLTLDSRKVFDADGDGLDDLLLSFGDGGSVTLIDVPRLTLFAIEFG